MTEGQLIGTTCWCFLQHTLPHWPPLIPIRFPLCPMPASIPVSFRASTPISTPALLFSLIVFPPTTEPSMILPNGDEGKRRIGTAGVALDRRDRVSRRVGRPREASTTQKTGYSTAEGATSVFANLFSRIYPGNSLQYYEVISRHTWRLPLIPWR